MFPELNEKATIGKVVELLSTAKVKLLRAGRSIETLRSPSLDGMPKAPSYRNNADASIIKRITQQEEAAAQIDEILRSVRCLDSDSQFIIDKLYLSDKRLNNGQIAQELNCERTKYSDLKRWAMLSFAEAYRWEDLRVFKKRTECEQI